MCTRVGFGWLNSCHYTRRKESDGLSTDITECETDRYIFSVKSGIPTTFLLSGFPRQVTVMGSSNMFPLTGEYYYWQGHTRRNGNERTRKKYKQGSSI